MSDVDSSTSSPKAALRPGGFSEGPNASSKSVTVASGEDTFGVRHDFSYPSGCCH